MHRLAERLPMLPTALRAALVVFVLAAIFGPYEVRSAVPVWIAFLVALGLEINFFLGALGRPPAPRPDRGPQEIDRELYGYRWPFEERRTKRTRTTRSRRRSASRPRCASSCSVSP